MQVGCLGDIIFEVTDKTVKTLTNAKWSGSANWSTHSRHLGDALLEFTGLAPDGFTFDIIFSASLGVEPLDELSKLWTYERDGTAVPLTIGEHGYGKYKWAILKHDIKIEHWRPDGKLHSCTVSVTLSSYLKD